MRTKSRSTYTTGEVSKICNVAQRTVIKWFDQKIIEGYIIPGTKDRRIPLTSLVEFMRSNNIPFDLIHLAEKGDIIEYCWEYNSRILGNCSVCENCIIYETRSLKCFAFIKKLDKLHKSSDIECEDCLYFIENWKNNNYDKQENSHTHIPYCWEFFNKSDDNKKDCNSCFVYKTLCLKCFSFFENIPCSKKICKVDCKDCNFYKMLEKYFILDESLKS